MFRCYTLFIIICMCVGYLDRNRIKKKTNLEVSVICGGHPKIYFSKKIAKILKNNTNGGEN